MSLYQDDEDTDIRRRLAIGYRALEIAEKARPLEDPERSEYVRMWANGYNACLNVLLDFGESAAGR